MIGPLPEPLTPEMVLALIYHMQAHGWGELRIVFCEHQIHAVHPTFSLKQADQLDKLLTKVYGQVTILS